MKILYIHNTLPEYRYGYFLELNRLCDLTIVFTDLRLSEKIYNTIIDERKLTKFNHIILSHNLSKDKVVIHNLITGNEYNLVIIPALDDVYSIALASYAIKTAKERNIKTGLFWEKWRADFKNQSIKRRLKETVQALLIKDALKKLDIFWAPGRKTKEYLLNQGISEKKVYSIHDSSVCEDREELNIRETYSIPTNLSIVLYLGRLVEYKGADVLIKAFSQTSQLFQEKHCLVIAGSGETEVNCKNIAKKLKINNIRFTGFVDPKYRNSFFKESDVFVLPVKITKGKVEAWGLTVNEAIQYDNVIIATDAVGVAFELVNNDNGYIVHENNDKELAEALSKSDELIHSESKTRMNKLICENYSYIQMANDILKPIEQLGIK